MHYAPPHEVTKVRHFMYSIIKSADPGGTTDVTSNVYYPPLVPPAYMVALRSVSVVVVIDRSFTQ